MARAGLLPRVSPVCGPEVHHRGVEHVNTCRLVAWSRTMARGFWALPRGTERLERWVHHAPRARPTEGGEGRAAGALAKRGVCPCHGCGAANGSAEVKFFVARLRVSLKPGQPSHPFQCTQAGPERRVASNGVTTILTEGAPGTPSKPSRSCSPRIRARPRAPAWTTSSLLARPHAGPPPCSEWGTVTVRNFGFFRRSRSRPSRESVPCRGREHAASARGRGWRRNPGTAARSRST
jgi:hypothetical protein